ncbi:MAG TPA: four helix bundle protein [bacterium]|nr:four helix bundle protein [bacterium]HPL95732.1 four helix bundle protein [bacterium]
MSENYKEKLKGLMDKYVNFVYNVTCDFPKEEIYGSAAQWRRASLSIILNYIEGYARKKSLVQLNFYEIAYGSFREAKYLLYFAHQRNFINEQKFKRGLVLSEEIGKMIWTELNSLEKSLK